VRDRHLSAVPSAMPTDAVAGSGQHYLDVYRDVLALVTANPPA